MSYQDFICDCGGKMKLIYTINRTSLFQCEKCKRTWLVYGEFISHIISKPPYQIMWEIPPLKCKDC